MDQEVASDSWTCGGCGGEIPEGVHSGKVSFEFETRMPPDYKPPVHVTNTVITARVHDPNCAVLWMANAELLKNVFG